MKNFFLVIVFFVLSSCGYKIANNLDNYNFYISEYELSGDDKINRILDKNFTRLQKKNNSSKIYEINSTSKINIFTTSKDISNVALTFKMIISIEIEVFENGEMINRTKFTEKTDYSTAESKFELKQYEDILLKNLVDQIVFKINNNLGSI